MLTKSGPFIGKTIRQKRKEQKLSQDKLSKGANLSYNTIIKIESGENPNPTLETLYKIAKALGIKLTDLIKDYDNPQLLK
jgi:transcriptional regulator with XRE-family HTH domain